MAEKPNQATASTKNAAGGPSERPTPPVPVAAAANPIMALRGEIDRLFDDFSSGFPRFDWARDLFDISPFHRPETRPRPLTPSFSAESPAANISESEKQFVITVDLPGMTEDDVEVAIDGDVLTVKGERSAESEEQDKDFRVVERHFGSFRRGFRLPEVVDQNKVAAKFTNGVLTLTLAKTKEAQTKRRIIPVKGG